MLEGLRAEFPELANARISILRPRISVESPWWSFVAANGAAFIVGGIVRLAGLTLYPIVFPPTEPGPGFSPATLADTSAAIAAGAVAMRAGGGYALLLYYAFELARILAGIPGRLLFCERAGGAAPTGVPFPCDTPAMLVGEWPLALAIAAGALFARILVDRRGTCGNWMVRGAGAFGLIGTAVGIVVGLLPGSFASIDDQFTVNNLFAVVQVLAGVVAGVVLARASFAAALLVVLLLVSIPLGFALPLALRPNGPIGGEAPELALMRWAGVYVPTIAAAAIFVARGYVRRHRGGTFF